ncbi:hypothetical protein OBB00_06980 [Gammaproteobacteria bacterium]|nr:hypothetical protein [Gammaproteobacteria bacterium]
MTIQKLMMFMLFLWIPALGNASQIVILDQTLHFKWKGLPVATIDFNVWLPVADQRASGSSSGTLPATALSAWPKTLIEVTGKTRGPLRLIEDYQATVKYVKLDAKGRNAMTLIGVDNGEPEKREIFFAPSTMPQVSIFEDSTAKQALQPRPTWARDTTNPLDIFKMMLESSLNNKECAAQTWGYDGKRRYFLQLERNVEGSLSAESSVEYKLFGGEIARRYTCKISMFTEGMQSASSDTRPSVFASRLAALWPFEGGDRELLFDFWVYAESVERGYTRLMFNEVQVATPLGAIIGGK